MREQVIEVIEQFAMAVEASSVAGNLNPETFKDHLEDAADDIMELAES